MPCHVNAPTICFSLKFTKFCSTRSATDDQGSQVLWVEALASLTPDSDLEQLVNAPHCIDEANKWGVLMRTPPADAEAHAQAAARLRELRQDSQSDSG